ncbi:MAG: metallophosphoesterase [Tunicatimonas sp.]
MPGIFYQPMPRKQFLKTSLGLSAAALGVPVSTFSYARTKNAHWAFLSDTHVAGDPEEAYRGFVPYQNLQTVVPQVLAAGPEGVIINGDVARLSGEKPDYQRVQQLLSPLAQQLPVHMTLGNHDNRDNFSEVFPGSATLVEGHYVHVIEAPPVRMILLDSLLYVNKVVGLLGKIQRSWLEMFLDSTSPKPTLIFVHHTLGDDDSDLQDVERMFDIIRPHSSVKAVLYGHSHRYQYGQRDDIQLINLPAVGYNFTDDQPVGWLEASLSAEGGAFTLHAIGGNRENDGQTVNLTWR